MWRFGVLIAVGACNGPRYPVYVTPAGAQAVVRRELPAFGVALDIPRDARLVERDTNAHISNGTFKLNLFALDERSAASAAEKKARLQREPGFVKFTKEQAGSDTWRFDYELADGLAGTVARIPPGLDCGVHGVSPAIANAVATACASGTPVH